VYSELENATPKLLFCQAVATHVRSGRPAKPHGALQYLVCPAIETEFSDASTSSVAMGAVAVILLIYKFGNFHEEAGAEVSNGQGGKFQQAYQT
jgi:hypothetical protein